MNSLQTTEAAMIRTERAIVDKNNIIIYAESYARNTEDEHFKSIFSHKAEVLKEDVIKLKEQLSVFKTGWKTLLNNQLNN